MKKNILILLYSIICTFGSAQETAKMVLGDWTFHPNYTLERNARNYPGNKTEAPKSRFQQFKTLGEPLLFYEKYPTERLTDFFEAVKLPQTEFSIELWILNHVNLPVGSLITARGKDAKEQPAWLLGYYGDEILFHIMTESGEEKTLTSKIKKGWKQYWGHLVGTYDGSKMKLYLNGELLAESAEIQGKLKYPSSSQIELAAYLEEEPYMETSNLVKASRLYNYALEPDDIKKRLDELQAMVEEGKLYPEVFHYNAGPYLNFATQTSINIVWETDRPAKAVVEYGKSLPLTEKKEISNFALIQEITLDNLNPETPYYYQIKSIAQDGKEINSGVLTFGTAVQHESAFSFCILGDTESRPHINSRLAKLIWEERPNFMLHLGDVTDGGVQNHKFEWNQEYFTGITQVASRIPMFPVAGNGESDLYWYKRYHRLPEPESYYTYTFGNARFFMLNSNEAAELKKGGVQYEWLRTQLAQSKATWKFVTHHHCPISSDEDDFGNTWEGKKSTQGDPRFDDLKRLYEEFGVDVVFYGHVHAYERSWPIKEGKINKTDGVIYIMSGGAGGHLEDFAPTHSWFSSKTQRGNHFCKVDIQGNEFFFKMYDLEGRLRDYLELKK
ncbi:MAG: metallophosphoesterase [Microscillaceae bacterium]|nr:metallophosphoesterase [Microscillaceae bacterium]